MQRMIARRIVMAAATAGIALVQGCAATGGPPYMAHKSSITTNSMVSRFDRIKQMNAKHPYGTDERGNYYFKY